MRNWTLVCILLKRINKAHRMLWLIKRNFNEVGNDEPLPNVYTVK